jgi:hypothetical protein
MPAHHPIVRLLSAIIIAALLSPPLRAQAQSAEAAASPAAVVPLLDGDADDESREAAAALIDALRISTGHRIVAADVAARVLKYRGGDGAAAGDAKHAADAIARAKEHYFNFRYREARSELDSAIAELTAMPPEAGAGALLVDAYLSSALIAKSRGDKAEMRRSLAQALAIHPALTLPESQYPPSLVKLAREVHASNAAKPSGSLAVASQPPGAEVLLNGIPRGVAPLELVSLPAGTYALSLRADRYRPEVRTIAVAAGQRAEVAARLVWQKEGQRSARDGLASKAAEDAADAVRLGLSIAEALKVDRAILVDADAAGADAVRITARTVERQHRAGQRPVVIPKMSADDRAALLAELTAALAVQLDADLTADPARALDPVGEADPVLLGKRKEKLTRRPLFWAIVGTIAVGALAGGIAASMGGGPGTGSVKVTFK